MSWHTRGPWEVREKTIIVAQTFLQGQPEKSTIATTDNPRLPPELCEANARLIARAPEMYEFLKYLLKYLDGLWLLQGRTGRLHVLLQEIEGVEAERRTP